MTDKKLEAFPVARELSCSKVLVIYKNGTEVVAACGIRGLLNVLVLHVKERYRGRRIGTQTIEKTIDISKKLGLSFITLSVSSNNAPALHLYSKFGFKEVVFLRKSNLTLMLLPIKPKGKIIYSFLRAVSPVFPQVIIESIHKFFYRKTLIVSNHEKPLTVVLD